VRAEIHPRCRTGRASGRTIPFTTHELAAHSAELYAQKRRNTHTRRHVATLLDLSPQECEATMIAPNASGRHWSKRSIRSACSRFKTTGIGPPQLAPFESAGREKGTLLDSSADAGRRERVQASVEQLRERVASIRSHLPAEK